jgi:hypothetical protein
MGLGSLETRALCRSMATAASSAGATAVRAPTWEIAFSCFRTSAGRCNAREERLESDATPPTQVSRLVASQHLSRGIASGARTVSRWSPGSIHVPPYRRSNAADIGRIGFPSRPRYRLSTPWALSGPPRTRRHRKPVGTCVSRGAFVGFA